MAKAATTEADVTNADMMRIYGKVYLIPEDNWTPLLAYVNNFRNCVYCRDPFYFSPNKPQFFSLEPFLCAHCAKPGTSPTADQGIYLGKDVLVDGKFPVEWYQLCACCSTKFFVTFAPPRKTVETKSVSKETGITRKMKIKTRTTKHLCDRCDGSRGEPKSPDQFGGGLSFTTKVGRKAK